MKLEPKLKPLSGGRSITLTRSTAWRSSQDASSQLILAIRKAEVDFSKAILLGLYPCIVTPRKELDTLAKWIESKRTLEQDVKEIEADRQRLKETAVPDPWLLWIQLNLWPLVLISALSLKFAKGVAALRKGNP